MTKYALVAPDNTIHTERDETRIDIDAGLRDGYRWLPIVYETDDQTTQSVYVVTEPMVETIEAARVLRSNVRRDMTPQEISGRKSALVLSEADTILAKAIFKLMNDVHPNAPFTKQQFLGWMEAQI